MYNSDGTPTIEFYLHRIKARYHFLFPTLCTKEELQYIFSYIDQVPPMQDCLVVSPKNYARAVFLGLLLRNQKYIDLKFYELQYLTEVWLGKHDDFPSLSYIHDKHLAISFSYNDLPNKNREDVILYLLENQIREKESSRWLFYNGSVAEFKSTFSVLYTYFKERNLPTILIPRFTPTPPVGDPLSVQSDMKSYF